MKMKTAIIDDSQTDLQYIFNALKNTKIPALKRLDIDYFASSEPLMGQLDQYQLFILDWFIDQRTGLDLLNAIRTQCTHEPAVIMLTSNNNVEDISTALLAGADDYLVKPYREIELCARVFNLMRRKEGSTSALTEKNLTIQNFTFDDKSLIITHDGIEKKLPLREYEIAKFLFLHLGEPISREMLYKKFWKKEEKYSSRSLDTHIYRIRNQLKLTAENKWQLHTIYGYGYRLEPVDKISFKL
ncbi:MAG: response regulator transcription factor [Gammaproteobacteria bacterium]|nr:response regulator transcription factor [Gammaproteobacteria bacterium]